MFLIVHSRCAMTVPAPGMPVALLRQFAPRALLERILVLPATQCVLSALEERTAILGRIPVQTALMGLSPTLATQRVFDSIINETPCITFFVPLDIT